jgi:hypothetical protein
MNETVIAIDINNTSLEDLCQVPGLGRAMAERVIANRPYDSIEDMTRVPGIGDVLLERLRPYVCVSAPVGIEMSPEEVAVALAVDDEREAEALLEEAVSHTLEAEEPIDIMLAPLPEAVEAGDEAAPVLLEPESPAEAEIPAFEPIDDPLPPSLDRIEPPPAAAITAAVEAPSLPFEAPPPAAPVEEPEAAAVVSAPPSPKSEPSIQSRPSRLEVLAYVLLGGFLALVLAVLISLGILRAINGDLIYATGSQFNGLQAQVGAMSGQVTALQSEITGMRGRLEVLEALPARVSAVEQEAQSLRSDLAAAESQLLALQAQTQELARQTEQLAARTTELEQRTRVFQNFLDGLRDLLVGLTAEEAK